MTPEDDAFIRKIVDSPGDDLPRLVYADWLDERDDPRGAYLRAELEWAKPWRDGNRPGDASEVRALALGLDDVWLARVSRPPVGVCCEHVHFVSKSEGVDSSAIREMEARCNSDGEIGPIFTEGLRFPHDYRAFLLNSNGGIAVPSGIPTCNADPVCDQPARFARPPKPVEFFATESLEEMTIPVRDAWFETARSDPDVYRRICRFISIGVYEEERAVLLWFDNNQSCIVMWDWLNLTSPFDASMKPVADFSCISEFLAFLHPKWKQR